MAEGAGLETHPTRRGGHRVDGLGCANGDASSGEVHPALVVGGVVLERQTSDVGGGGAAVGVVPRHELQGTRPVGGTRLPHLDTGDGGKRSW